MTLFALYLGQFWWSRHILSLLSLLIELFQIPGWNFQPLKLEIIRIIPASTRSCLKGDHAANVMCYSNSSSLCLANLFSISATASQARSLERLSRGCREVIAASSSKLSSSNTLELHRAKQNTTVWYFFMCLKSLSFHRKFIVFSKLSC